MHIWKSAAVLIFFLLLILLTLKIAIKSYKDRHSRIKVFLACVLCMVSLLAAVSFCDYLYPFDRNVRFTLFATIEIPDEHKLSRPGTIFWHSAYEKYGLYAESFYFDPSETVSYLGFEWPEFDFDNHTYIITYGQKLN